MVSDPVVGGIFHRPFPEQVAAYRLRLGNLVPTSRWDDLRESAHDRAFMVAGAAKADLLADLAGAVDNAVAQGGTLEDFRRDFRGIVERHGWHGWTGEGTKAGEAWRTRVIYRTNVATSFSAGRLAQLKAAGFPFWIYRHSGAEHPRLDHQSWDRIVLPADHPFWEQHYPPNGWGCGCQVSGSHSLDNARRRGGDPDKTLPDDWDSIDARTGEPVGIGKGWGYAPGASVADQLNVLKDKLPKLPAPIGAAWFAGLPDRRRAELARDFAAFVDESLAAKGPRGRHMVVGALKPEWVKALGELGAAPASAEMAVRDEDVRHTFRRAKSERDRALDLDWYKGLPLSLHQPDLVLLQREPTGPALLLFYTAGDPGQKIVTLLDYRMKKGSEMINILRTGNTVGPHDIASMVADKARYTIIEGEGDL